MKNQILTSKPDTISCGMACLYIVLNDLGIKIDFDNLTSILPIKEYGTWTTDLGIIALSFGCKVEIVNFSTSIFKPSWFMYDTDKLKSILKQNIETDEGTIKNARKSVLDFIQKGGILKFMIMDQEELINSSQESGTILCLASDILHLEDGISSGHFVVLKGYTKDRFIIYNPQKNYILKQELFFAHLLFSLYKWGGWVLRLTIDGKENMG